MIYTLVLSIFNILRARRAGSSFGLGGGANISGGSPSRGSDGMGKIVWKGGGQKKNLHHHHSCTLHAVPAERFSKWKNDQVERKLAWGPGPEPR